MTTQATTQPTTQPTTQVMTETAAEPASEQARAVAQQVRPLVLVRGFGGPDISDEQANAYQGFNNGTVYPRKRGENFIYEGFVLRALKSRQYTYTDATNVVAYYRRNVRSPEDPTARGGYDPQDLEGSVVIDPQTAKRVLEEAGAGTIWVYRYYDLTPRTMETYGRQLVRLVSLIEKAMSRHGQTFRGVDIVAHSMGGLVVREALRLMAEPAEGEADDPPARRERTGRRVHRVVTLGTPHRGIAFAGQPPWLLRMLPKLSAASDEFAAFDPEKTSFTAFKDDYDPGRILTVVGTNYRTYGNAPASAANRAMSLFEDGTLATNRSDGLVKQSAAQLPGSPRTFIHKCHGGLDSLVTSREAYEIAMRFFHGSHHVRLYLEQARIGGSDREAIGKPEFYFGVSIKPRDVDFELFHQSVEAENCYGPFRDRELTRMDDDEPYVTRNLEHPLDGEGRMTGWLDEQRLIWEGWVDKNSVPAEGDTDMVFRLTVYVGERDSHGTGFSDDVIADRQYYVQVVRGAEPRIFLHRSKQLVRSGVSSRLDEVHSAADDQDDRSVQEATPADDGWHLKIDEGDFSATLRIEVSAVEQ